MLGSASKLFGSATRHGYPVVHAERCHRNLEEGAAPLLRVEQGSRNFRPHSGERQAGQPGAGTQVEKCAAEVGEQGGELRGVLELRLYGSRTEQPDLSGVGQ
jgi:hypothetical protein